MGTRSSTIRVHCTCVYTLLTLPPNMDFLLLLRALLCEGEAGIPPDSLAGCDRLDCEGEVGKDEGMEHWLCDEDTERKLEKPGELRARRQAGGT